MAVPPDKGLLWLVSCLVFLRKISRLILEPTTGLEPVNLFLTKEVLYQLSHSSSPAFETSPRIMPRNESDGKGADGKGAHGKGFRRQM